MTYNMPTNLVAPAGRYDVATNMAFFLMANDHKIFDTWRGKMKAVDQRKIFGVKLGKGTIVINGEKDRAACRVKTCFGQDSDENVWIDCTHNYIGQNWFSIGEGSAHEKEIVAARTALKMGDRP